MERAVEIHQLNKSYGSKEVLTGFSLSIPAGNIFGLIGPNGAGKSTLLGILTGLLDYENGEIIIGGRPFTEKNEIEIKKEVASVLQPPLLFEHFTSFDFLDYVCDMYQVKKDARSDKIHSLFDYLSLAEFKHTKINKLSSGSRKKLSFCAAVLSEPRLLFLDEPFESIDVISIGRMKSIIKRLQEKGVTIVVTSHILEIVENLCDDIAILNKGKIIAYLDSTSRREMQRDASLSEIFESYINVEKPKSDVLSWL